MSSSPQPSYSGMHVKGGLLRARFLFVVLNHGADTWARVLSTLPDDERESLKDIVVDNWYPLGTLDLVDRAIAEQLIVDLERGTDRPPHETLSNREFQVLRLIASGKTVAEIAETLSLSDNTISTYRARILEKMGMKTNAELTHYAIRNQLVD